MFKRLRTRTALVVIVLIGICSFSTSQTQPVQGNESPVVPRKSAAVVPQRYHTRQLPNRGQQYFALVWGIDSLAVKLVESGELIKFTYRVIDPQKAKVLNDKRNEPSLADARAGVKLVVPNLEKVGQLRQSSTPEAGKVYWMAFSNKGRLVKPGHFVDVAIGNFRANGLIVQ
jgi:hypothetical protein